MKRLVLLGVAVLVLVGIYDALRNLPVISGCAFYAECPAGPAVAAPPESLPVEWP